ncbi:MAG: YjbQ family protein, partial [Candidatus Limnocylindria bacterium]
PLLASPSLTVPVVDGTMTLGTWQSIALLDPNGDNPRRRVRLAFLAG